MKCAKLVEKLLEITGRNEERYWKDMHEDQLSKSRTHGFGIGGTGTCNTELM